MRSPVAVGKPVICRIELVSVLKTISFVSFGVNVTFPVVVKSLLLLSVRLLLMYVVPVAAPIVRVVAAPPKLIVVALVLKSDARAEFVVMSPPLTARSPFVWTFPFRVAVPSIVRLPFACMLPAGSSVVPVSPYPPPTWTSLNLAVALSALNAVVSAKLIVVP